VKDKFRVPNPPHFISESPGESGEMAEEIENSLDIPNPSDDEMAMDVDDPDGEQDLEDGFGVDGLSRDEQGQLR
jgi:hypothetical protein